MATKENGGFELDGWPKVILILLTVLATCAGTVWNASAQYTKLEARVLMLESRNADILVAFSQWKAEHAAGDRIGWEQNEKRHIELMAGLRENGLMLQEVQQRQAVVLDRLKIEKP